MKTIMISFLTALFLFAHTISVQAEEVLVVLWQGKYVSETEFEKRLTELRPGTKFTYINAERNALGLERQLRAMDLSQFHLVYSFGTAGTKIVKKHIKGQIPQVFNIVSAPVISRIAQSIKKPGDNLTGAKLLVDMKTQLDVMQRLRHYKTLGVFYDPREAQNTPVLSQINTISKAMGKTLVPIEVIPESTNFEEMLKEASKKANKLDALYFLASPSFHPHSKKLHAFLNPKLLIMGSTRLNVEAGSNIAVGADFGERGRAAAQLAHRILNGEKAGEIPVDTVTTSKAFLYVNKDKMAAVGLKNLNKLGMTIRYLQQDR